MKRMTTLIYILLILYLALLGVMFVFQRHLLYHPDRNVGSPQQYGLSGFEDLRAKSTDGLSIQMWYRPAKEGFPTIVYYHGNASNLGNRAGIYGALADKGFGVLALSYRGYGKSEGEPSEQGLYDDARAAIGFLTDSKHIPIEKILVFGESLGTGVATQMATEYPVGGLILEAAYTSVAARAAEIYFYIPVKLLIRDRFDSLSKIAKVKCPILFFHGELDPTIPVAHGRALIAAVTAPKETYFFPDIHHNDFDSNVLSAHVLDFARKYRLVAQ